jgi:Zn-finger protein
MEHYKFFQNKECEFFPCHQTEDASSFNCLFCFCPLYCLKDECGGDFRYMDNGVKDCTPCARVHNEKSHDYVMRMIDRIVDLGRR